MKVQTAYRILAPRYDRLRPLWAGGRLGGAELFLEGEILPRYCPPGSVILDLGCGTGANLERLLRLGISFRQYVGIDLSPVMLGYAQKKFSHLKSVEFCQSNIQQLPFDDNTFEFALSTWAMEHAPYVNLAMDEALRILKGGAYLALLFHSLPYLPWRAPARLIEPIFKLAFQMRFLTPHDYYSSHSKGAIWQFAQGLHTLLLLEKEGGS
jgi:ubiquinone/menaquinone biosynthesis C-methylase UbiE